MMAARRARPRRPDWKRRRAKAFAYSIAAIALALVIALDRAGVLMAPRNDVRRYDGVTVRVNRVIDGDTIIVDLADPRTGATTTRVRLWGIDTPELARAGAPAEPFAVAAARFVETMVEGRWVTLLIEPHRPRGRYGRVLAHVRLESGEILAVEVLRAGLGRADARWPHRWVETFAAAERTARREGVGMWSDEH